MSSILRFPRPRSFLHIISLRTATEFIVFTLALNKITGLYGILALLTGYELNPLQLSHYIYSLVVLGLIAYLHPSIRQHNDVLKNISLAWIYVLDTIVNSVYTALFGTGWFVLLAQHLNDPVGPTIPGQGTINDTAGFTNPEINANKVEVLAAPAPGIIPGQEAQAFAINDGSDIGNAVFQSGSMASITVIGMLWIVRIYFCIIIMSFARSVLRQYVATTSTATYSQPEDLTMGENPFRPGREEGEGLRGKFGRLMLRLPSKRYWLGRDESEEWVRATSGRFEGGGLRRPLRVRVPSKPGVGERERRARGGTGPPAPSPQVKQADD